MTWLRIRPALSIGLLTNKPLLLSIFATVLLQLAVIYSLPKYIFSYATANRIRIIYHDEYFFVVFVAVEIEKWFRRLRKSKSR